MKQLFVILILSLLFVIFSFSPSIYEIYNAQNLPPERSFVLEHNYMFDYNFYLSRIREGQEGRWLVVEKYYNQPHQGSLFQAFYLMLGRLGRLEPPVIYHGARLIFGLVLLVLLGKFVSNFFTGIWQLVAYLFIVTAGSWPILVKAGNFYRFATYMGWWSVIDSLQKITIMPHILFGQIFMLLFIWRFGGGIREIRVIREIGWGVIGFIVGIVFPPTLIVVYTVFGIISLGEFIFNWSDWSNKSNRLKEWFLTRVIPRIVFILLSFPSLVYLQLMFKVLPWSALALFDIQHRMPLPYKEYFLALGPMLPLGVLGGLAVLKNREKRLLPVVSWVLGVFLLFAIFEKIPIQSPLRFTEVAIHIPLGILAVYLFQNLFHLSSKFSLELKFRRFIKMCVVVLMFSVISMGLGVMVSMVGWLTDQAYSKGKGTWLVPIGAQLVYPLKDFMDGIYYLRDNTKREEVVLAYVTAGNYIPAYAGNFVYIGHANTPDEDGKEKIAARFFKGEMSQDEAKEFLIRENIKYIYFGPQEREVGKNDNLATIYPFLLAVYKNNQVTIYKFGV